MTKDENINFEVLIHNGIIVLSLKNNWYITSDKPANIISVCLFVMKIMSQWKLIIY